MGRHCRLVVVAAIVVAGGAATPASAAPNAKAVVVAVDDAGHTHWKRTLDHDLTVVGEAGGVVFTVGIASCDATTATLRALDAHTGKPKWEQRVTTREGSIPLAVYAGKVVVIPASEATLEAFDGKTGRVAWHSTALGGGSSYRSLVGAGDRVIASVESAQKGPQATTGVDAATGKIAWSDPVAGSWYRVPNPTDGTRAFTTTPSGTTIDDSTTAMTAYDVESGAVVWQTSARTHGARAFTAAGAGVVIGGEPLGAPPQPTTVVALDAATGAPRWTLPEVSTFFPGLVAVGSDRLFTDVGGRLVALVPADGTVAWSVANSGTPPFALIAGARTLAVGTAVGPRTTTTAYGVTDGRPHWERQGFSPAAAGATATYLSDRLGAGDCNAGE